MNCSTLPSYKQPSSGCRSRHFPLPVRKYTPGTWQLTLFEKSDKTAKLRLQQDILFEKYRIRLCTFIEIALRYVGPTLYV